MRALLIGLALAANPQAVPDSSLDRQHVVDTIRSREGDGRAALVDAAYARTECDGCRTSAEDGMIVLGSQLQSAIAAADCRIPYDADAPGKSEAAIRHRNEELAHAENLDRMRDALRRIDAITGDASVPPSGEASPTLANATRAMLGDAAMRVCLVVESAPPAGWSLEDAMRKLQHRCVTERGRLLQNYALALAEVSTAPGNGPACRFPDSIDTLLAKVEDAYL